MTMDDVEILLNNSPSAGQREEINEQCMETWNIALWNNHKLFVGHPYYQDYLWKKICGFSLHWENYYFYRKVFYFFFSILIFFTYPFVVLFDTIFGNNDILFNHESETEKYTVKHTLTSKFRIEYNYLQSNNENHSIERKFYC